MKQLDRGILKNVIANCCAVKSDSYLTNLEFVTMLPVIYATRCMFFKAKRCILLSNVTE